VCQSDCLTQVINGEMSSGVVAVWFMSRIGGHWLVFPNVIGGQAKLFKWNVLSIKIKCHF